MKREGLPDTWHKIVLSLSLDAVEQVETQPGDSLDIRSLIKVKKLPGGNGPEDSCIVPGEAFTVRMNARDVVRRLEKPKILMLAGSVSCGGRDGGVAGYADVVQVSNMEDEYLRSVCSKIKSFRPDLILVEKAVAQRAQHLLADMGIAYVFNVRSTVMWRLRRIFRTEIYSSVLSIIQVPVLGAARLFEVRYGSLNDIKSPFCNFAL